MNFNSPARVFSPSTRIIFFGRNYFLIYELFSRLADTKTREPSCWKKNTSHRVFCYVASLGASFSGHNYVQLQFHKSMIYSYGLHFYSIRYSFAFTHTKNISIIASFFITFFLTSNKTWREIFVFSCLKPYKNTSKVIFLLIHEP